MEAGYVLSSSGNTLCTWYPPLDPFSLPLRLAEYFGQGADLRKSLKFILVFSFAKVEKPWGLLDPSNLRDEASSVYSCSHRAMIKGCKGTKKITYECKKNYARRDNSLGSI